MTVSEVVTGIGPEFGLGWAICKFVMKIVIDGPAFMTFFEFITKNSSQIK